MEHPRSLRAPAKSNQCQWIEDRAVAPSLREKESGLANWVFYWLAAAVVVDT